MSYSTKPAINGFQPMFFNTGGTPISTAEFEILSRDARVLEADKRGDKVLLTPDNRIIKLFYPRRRLTSARLYPYAFRFCRNARKLREKGIPSVHCEQLRHDRENNRHLVSYPLLPGNTLRDYLEETGNPADDIERLAVFLARLHANGVMFRSIHLGNILVLENNGFGLIDIADMHIGNRPLGAWKRARNFPHLLRYPQDRETIATYGYRRFLDRYTTAAKLDGWRETLFRKLLQRYAPVMTGRDD